MASWTIERDGDVAVIARDDGKANTVLVPQFQDLERALDEVAASSALAVVLTGRPGYFSAGLNIKALPGMEDADRRALVSAMGSAVLKLFTFPRPVVAAVSGHALGAGAMFALAADCRIFADGAFKFGLNEVAIGMFVPTFAIELARSAVSASRMTDLVMHGRVLSPMEALQMHVAEAVHSPEALLSAALIRARGLVDIAGTGYAITKRLLRDEVSTAAMARLPGELDELVRLFPR